MNQLFAYGANGADGHHEGDDSLLKPGDSIVIDMGGIYQGYCSDMTRTVFYKEVSDELKEKSMIWLEKPMRLQKR